MLTCPYCEMALGDLDHIMDQLAQNKLNEKLHFQSACCNQEIKAYSNVGMYYIVKPDGSSKPQMIGAA